MLLEWPVCVQNLTTDVIFSNAELDIILKIVFWTAFEVFIIKG